MRRELSCRRCLVWTEGRKRSQLSPPSPSSPFGLDDPEYSQNHNSQRSLSLIPATKNLRSHDPPSSPLKTTLAGDPDELLCCTRWRRRSGPDAQILSLGLEKNPSRWAKTKKKEKVSKTQKCDRGGGKGTRTDLVGPRSPPSAVREVAEVRAPDESSSNADQTGEEDELPSLEGDGREKAEGGTEPEERSWRGGEEVEVEGSFWDATKEERRLDKVEVRWEKVEAEVEMGLVG